MTLEALNSDPEILLIPNTTNPPVEDSTKDSSIKDNSDTTVTPNTTYKPFVIAKGSRRYVISIDNKPKFYVDTIEKVPTKVDEIMEYLTDIHPDYNMFTNQVAPNVWTISRSYRWFAISYEEIVKTITCNTIHQIEFTPCKDVPSGE